MKTILITGIAGFIGMHTAKELLDNGHTVIGIDNFCKDVNYELKISRIKMLLPYENFFFYEGDIRDKPFLENVFNNDIDYVINLGAKANVRESMKDPETFINTNITGFLNVLEQAKENNVEKVLYASSSSVYGANQSQEFKREDQTDKPISVYAVTKKSNELFAYMYSKLYGIHTIGLRFFTVYGPYGRSDMAIYKFVKKILNGEEISVYNNGNMERDWIHVSDVVKAIELLLKKEPPEECVPYEIFNIGTGRSVSLIEMIGIIENTLGIKAKKVYLPMQDGDVKRTHANINPLKALGYRPKVQIEDGIADFVRWYRQYEGGRERENRKKEDR